MVAAKYVSVMLCVSLFLAGALYLFWPNGKESKFGPPNLEAKEQTDTKTRKKVKKKIGGEKVFTVPWPDSPSNITVTTETLSTISKPLRFHNLHYYNQHLIWVGGETDADKFIHRYSNKVQSIDLSTRNVTDIVKLPMAVAHHDSLIIGDYLIVVGGMSSTTKNKFHSSTLIQTVNLKNGKTGTFDFGEPGCHDPEAVTVSKNRFFVAGGWNNLFASKRAMLFNFRLETGKVTKVREWEVPFARSYPHAHLIEGGRVAVVAGFHHTTKETRNLDNIALVDIDLDKKMTLFPGKLKTPRRSGVSQRIGSKVYVIGGTLNNGMGRGKAHGEIEVIDFKTGKVSGGGKLNVPRFLFSSAVIKRKGRDYILICGGQRNDFVPALKVEIYDVSSKKSYVIPGLEISSVDHDRIMAFKDNVVYILGGEKITSKGITPGSKELISIEFEAGVRFERTSQ